MKIYMVSKTTDDVIEKLAFAAKKGEARKLGRELNDGKRLTTASGVTVNEQVILGGRSGLVSWLNANFAIPVIAAPKAKKGKKR